MSLITFCFIFKIFFEIFLIHFDAFSRVKCLLEDEASVFADSELSGFGFWS
jgi:hypothetical protein